MAQKDQCDRCRFQTYGECSQLLPFFDGASCCRYIGRKNLLKNGEVASQAVESAQAPVLIDDQASLPQKYEPMNEVNNGPDTFTAFFCVFILSAYLKGVQSYHSKFIH